MSTRIAVLLDEDTEYVNRLCSFSRHPPYSDRFQLLGFTNREAFEGYLREKGKPTVTAGTAAALRWVKEGEDAGKLVELLEHAELYETTYERLYKYQSAIIIMNELTRMLEQPRKNHFSPDHPLCRVWAVVSAAGGSGKTTVSLNLVSQLSRSGKKVLFVNLESTESFSEMHPSFEFGCGLSRLIFDGRGHSGITSSSLSESTGPAQGASWQTVRREAGYRELDGMAAQDVTRLIQSFVNNGGYDAVIIDTDEPGHARTRQVLSECDAALWLVRDDAVTLGKTTRLFADYKRESLTFYEDVVRKSLFVLNKHTGNRRMDYVRHGFRIEAELPYVPVWKQVESWDRLLQDPVFQAGCAGLVELLLQGRKEAAV